MLWNAGGNCHETLIEQAPFPCYNTSMKNLEGCIVMKEKAVSASLIRRVVVSILIVLSVIASATKIFTGFDIDEAYALAIPYRVLQGDRLFADMWEVHQTSFLLPFLFMKVFYLLTGEMAGVVLYMRIMTTLLHLCMSILVYGSVKKFFGMKGEYALLIGLAYYNFLPKWMINMDFSMEQLWFFTLFVICLFCAGIFDGMKQNGGERQNGKVQKAESLRKIPRGKKNLWIAASGLMLALDVLAYPGMIILYPVTVFLLLCKRKSGKWADVLSLTAGCFVAAALFFVCIFRYMSLGELLEAVPKVFMDGSHQYDFATKLGLYASQWLEVLVQSAILLVPTLVFALVFRYLYKRLSWEEKWGGLSFGLLFCTSFELLVSGLIAFAGVFVTWGPFRLQVRYIIQFVMAFCLWKAIYYKRNSGGHREAERITGKKSKTLMAGKTEAEDIGEKGIPVLWLLLLSLAAFAGILLASNVGPVSSSSYLVMGNIAFMAFVLKGAEKRGRGMKTLAYTGTVLFILSLIMCKGYYMRNTEYVPGDISEPLSKMQEGPMAGIYVPQKDFARYTDDYKTIKGHTTDHDLVLFMGTEGLCNLYANGKIVIPTTISTPAFNEQWVEYFTLYPDKQPTVIFLAKNTVDDRDKFFVKNVFGIWIAERYDVECMEETESLCIIRLRED